MNIDEQRKTWKDTKIQRQKDRKTERNKRQKDEKTERPIHRKKERQKGERGHGGGKSSQFLSIVLDDL